ncbi:MAG: HEPN domain-containing protein [Ignavibacteria bacterium]|nr:HEPN domain-containing protein [Ignavibacteria bacterium]
MIKETIVKISKMVSGTNVADGLKHLNEENRNLITLFNRLKEIIEVNVLKNQIVNDPILKDAVKIAGANGLADRIIHMVFVKSTSLLVDDQSKIFCNPEKAFLEFERLRDLFLAKEVECEGCARILGLEPYINEIIINEEVKIVRLCDNDQKLNEPILKRDHRKIEKAEPSDEYKTEIKVRFKYPVNPKEEMYLLKAEEKAREKTRNICRNVLSALYLILPGKFDLGQIESKSFFQGTCCTFARSDLNIGFEDIKFEKDYTQKFIEILNILNNGQQNDEMLERVMRRYNIRRTRDNDQDKLIDYVIAWESILLTVNGNPIRYEMAYRFRLNGSSVIRKCLPDIERKDVFNFFDNVYDIRSSIVHGESEIIINKKVCKSKFANLNELTERVDYYLRETICWLLKMEYENRPYKKDEEWENLLWE